MCAEGRVDWVSECLGRKKLGFLLTGFVGRFGVEWTMRAIVYDQYGAPEVLRIAEMDTPSPKDDEVLIRVRAAEATKSDCELRSFRYPVLWFWLPLRLAMGIRRPRNPVLGGYFSGEIAEVGKDVSRFKVGDLVFGASRLRFGAYGEYLCLPENYTIVPKPVNLSHEEAAAVLLGGLNALHFLRKAKVQEGESVLINGAGGSIGSIAVQIAKAMGAKVTAVDSSNKKDFLLGIGADSFIDYAETDFGKAGVGYDVVFDMVAGSSYSACIKSLNAGGRYLTANPRFSKMLRTPFTSKFSDKEAFFAFAGETEEELLALKQMIEAGTIKPAVDRVYRMEEAAEAHRRVETEGRLGCVVISLSGR